MVNSLLNKFRKHYWDISWFKSEMKMSEFEELARAVASLSKSIADFPVGAISINDLKPTEEKIRDLRNSLKELKARMLMLRSKAEAQKSSDIPEGSEQDTYDQLQDGISHCIINNITLETCLQNSAFEEILESSDKNDISETFKAIMKKMYKLNDEMIGLEQVRSEMLEKETKLKHELQESLVEFTDFLKQQEDIRNKKLQETNPEVAQQKESIQKRVQKVNIMKRLITNLAGASMDIVKENPVLQEMCNKHRELSNIETVLELAKEATPDDS